MNNVVGLDYARDKNKYPTQLSGGMGRRASLALQLAQHKHLVVLDEPFTGLDYDSAISIAYQLYELRRQTQTSLLLISHELEYANIVMYGSNSNSNSVDDGTDDNVLLGS